jgi:CheY-like chemotaxis protein
MQLRRERSRPDLIVLDLHFPDINRVEVLRRLRADRRHTSVIVVTADATKGQAETVRGLGADEYLTKPLDVRSFLDAVSRHLPDRSGPERPG